MTDQEIIEKEIIGKEIKSSFVNPFLSLIAFLTKGNVVILTDTWNQPYQTVAYKREGYYKSWVYFLTRVAPPILYPDGGVKYVDNVNHVLSVSYIKKWKFA